MSATALRTGSYASRRSFGAAPGADVSSHELGRREDRVEAGRTQVAPAADALEPHWQASIESATD